LDTLIANKALILGMDVVEVKRELKHMILWRWKRASK
jgi:hypothetical protein